MESGPTQKPGVWVVAINIGMAWMLAEQAAQEAKRELLKQYPVSHAMAGRTGWFFEYKQ